MLDNPNQDQPVTEDMAEDLRSNDEQESSEIVNPLIVEVENLKEQLLRAVAETENVRKRSMREKEDALKYAATKFAKDMLSVCDNLHRAIDSVPTDSEQCSQEALQALVDGIKMTEKELISAFTRHGVAIIHPQQGDKFSYEHHQAMFEVASDDQEPGTITSTMQVGYTMHDRLLRPAMVGVAKK